MSTIQTTNNMTTLFVGGLNPETTEESIFTKLNSIGVARNVRLVKNKKTGLSRCFAFFDVLSSQASAIFLEPRSDCYLDNRPLFFQKANTNETEKVENSQKRVYLKNLPL